MTIIDRADVEKFRAIVAHRLGLAHEDGKQDFLADVLRERMEATGASRFDRYAEMIGAVELGALAERLTVNETFFFRNADQFRALSEVALPERIAAHAHANDRRLRILSAGCASGEEPYSIAVAVREAIPEIAAWDIEIRAFDINPAILAKAALARYTAWSLRATPEDTQRRYFQRVGKELELLPAIVRMVAFEQRNFAEDDPQFWGVGLYDIVFFRNVLMYFTPTVMVSAVARVTRALAPGGFLFLGHAETLRGLTQDFHLRHTHDTFYYQRRGDGEPTSVLPLPSVRSGDPIVVDPAVSWIEAIQRASDRIASLAHGAQTTPPAVSESAPPPRRSPDLGFVLDAMRQERFVEALDLLQALPPEARDNPDTLLLHAVLLTNHGQLAQAEQVCTRLLDFDELNAGAHYVVALCREHAGDTAGALEHDQTAIYLDPQFAMPHLHLGLAARRSGDAATARRELAQALSLFVREDVARVLLFGGGFSRETLIQLCRNELRAVGGHS